VTLHSVVLADLGNLVSAEYSKYANTTLAFEFRMSNGTTQYPRTDEDLRRLLRQLVVDDEMKVTVVVTTPARPYSEWTFPEVCRLFGMVEIIQTGRFPTVFVW